jgi:hypothetical protein
VVDNDFRFIHAAGNLDNVASLSFVIIGDGVNTPELQQEFSEALTSNHFKTPVLKIGIMSDRDAATDATIRVVTNDSKIRERKIREDLQSVEDGAKGVPQRSDRS